jgi:hypothetical protein
MRAIRAKYDGSEQDNQIDLPDFLNPVSLIHHANLSMKFKLA